MVDAWNSEPFVSKPFVNTAFLKNLWEGGSYFGQINLDGTTINDERNQGRWAETKFADIAIAA